MVGPGDIVVIQRDTAPVFITLMFYMYAVQYKTSLRGGGPS